MQVLGNAPTVATMRAHRIRSASRLGLKALLGGLLTLSPALAFGGAADVAQGAAPPAEGLLPEATHTEPPGRQQPLEPWAGQEEESTPKEVFAPGATHPAEPSRPQHPLTPRARQEEEGALTGELAREISAEDFTRLFTPAPADWQPRTGWAYTAYGTAAFIPVGGWVASGLAAGGRQPFWTSGVNALAAGALGFVPASLGGLYSNPVRGRWRDVDVAIFGLSLLLTPPLAGLGAWSSQALFFGGHETPGRAWLAASLGALVGHLVGMALDSLLRDRFPIPALGGYRLLLAVSCVGSGASLGQALFSRPAR